MSGRPAERPGPAIPEAELDLSVGLGEAGLYHDAGRHGFFAVLQRHDGGIRQESFRLSRMPEVLRLLPRDRDSWISQAEFTKPNRRLVNVVRIGTQFSDLDTYRSAFAEHTPGQQVGTLLDHLDAANKPLPSLIISSGRGLYPKWLPERAVPAAALPRWNAVQRAIADDLRAFGADPRARDASRVLRLENTVNTRSGRYVRVLWENTRNGQVVRYDFEDLCREFLPWSRGELAEHRAERERRRAAAEKRRSSLKVILGGRHGLRRLDVQQLWWDRLHDLRLLPQLRGWHAGNPPGRRNTFVYLAVCAVSWAVEPALLHREAQVLAREFAPTWTQAEVRSAGSTAIDRAVRSARGEAIELDGKRLDPRYRWTNERLMDWLEVTPDEERQLRTIISEEEERRRGRLRETARRRAAGAMPRGEYEAGARERREQARLMARLGHSRREIAAALDISPRWVRTLLRDPPDSTPQMGAE